MPHPLWAGNIEEMVDPTNAFDDPEASDLKALWIETNDIAFAAQAIGRLVDNPPPWAMIACFGHHLDVSRRTSRGNRHFDDGEIMDATLRCQLWHYEDAVYGEGVEPDRYIPLKLTTAIRKAMIENGWKFEDEGFQSRERTIRDRFNEERISEASEVLKSNAHLLKHWQGKTGKTEIADVAAKFEFPVEYGMKMTQRAEAVLLDQGSRYHQRLEVYLKRIAGID